MKRRFTNPSPELVEQIPVTENFGLRVFRYKFKRTKESPEVGDASILAAARELLQIESPRETETPLLAEDDKNEEDNHKGE